MANRISKTLALVSLSLFALGGCTSGSATSSTDSAVELQYRDTPGDVIEAILLDGTPIQAGQEIRVQITGCWRTTISLTSTLGFGPDRADPEDVGAVEYTRDQGGLGVTDVDALAIPGELTPGDYRFYVNCEADVFEPANIEVLDSGDGAIGYAEIEPEDRPRLFCAGDGTDCIVNPLAIPPFTSSNPD